jgi:hypothetical protein
MPLNARFTTFAIAHAKRFALAGMLAFTATSAMATAQAQTPTNAATARVHGIVFDSITMRPLVGATVQVTAATNLAQSRTVTTDTTGAWHLAALPAGSYLVGVTHPLLDSLALELPTATVTAIADADVALPIATPAPETFLHRACPNTADSTGLLIVRVRAAATGAAIPGATLVARWTAVQRTTAGIRIATPAVQLTAGDEGVMSLCGVPVETTVQLRAMSGADSTGTLAITLPARGLLWRDLFLGAASNSRDTSARVVGIVQDPRGKAIGGAQIALVGTAREVTATSAGRFVMPNLPYGTQTFDVRAIGYIPERVLVDVRGDAAPPVTIALRSRGTVLDSVRITARGTSAMNAMEFERHARSGLGAFFGDSAIRATGTGFITDLIRRVPGITTRTGAYTAGGDTLYMKGLGSTSFCIPNIFVDGTKLADAATLDRIVATSDVIGIEVYTRPSEIPAEFMGYSNCGAVVVWTGRGRMGPLSSPP